MSKPASSQSTKSSSSSFLSKAISVLQKVLCFLASSKMRMENISRNNALIILLFALFLNVAAAHFQAANAKQAETDGDISIQELPAQLPQPTKQKTDPFTIAIIGMSLGCMCVTGAVHWNLCQRNKIEGSIQKLDSFILNNCSVDLMLAKSADNEPMFNTVQNLQESHRLEMVKNQDGNNEMINKISGIEAEIMRILG